MAAGTDNQQAPVAPSEKQASQKRRIDMPTFGPLWGIRYQIPHIGGHQIIPGREITLSQLLIGFFALVIVGWFSGLFFSGPIRVLLAVVAAGGAGMFVARVDSGGRSVWRVLRRLIAFGAKCKLYHGAAAIGPNGSKNRKKRLVALLEEDNAALERQQGFFGVVFEGLSEIYSDLMDVYGPKKRRQRRGGKY